MKNHQKNFFSKKKFDDEDYESHYETVYDKYEKQHSKKAIEKRCIQRAEKNFNIIPGTSYSASIILTLPDAHYERLTANTPLYAAQGQSSVMRPIPTPTRSNILSVARTLFTLPLLLFGIVPETNEVEINLWGGNSHSLMITEESHFTFIIESCALQILDASVIITPHLSILERFLTRFPFFSILCIATILQSISIGLFSAILIYYFQPSFVTSYFDRNVENIVREESESENEVENLEKLRRSVDSWSELQESD